MSIILSGMDPTPGNRFSPSQRNGNFIKPRNPNQTTERIRVTLATKSDRAVIYRLRHEVYADELGQHLTNSTGSLHDALDEFNTYLVASFRNEIVGFISITPPGGPSYSVDKYFSRDQLPFVFNQRLYEVRLLTVRKQWRGRPIAFLLMYAAFRWIEAHGGAHIVAIGRRDVLPLYFKAGLEAVGLTVQAGAVTYDVLQASVAALRKQTSQFARLLGKLASEIDWALGIAFAKPTGCFHGGAFFRRIGERFETLEKHKMVINADVLDAWFPPSPRVTEAIQEHLPWLLRTSPPTHCDGMIDAIAEARGVPRESILPGAGSSNLIFLALRHWLKSSSRTLILDPTYGEYRHVLESVIGCSVDKLVLRREDQYRLCRNRFLSQLDRHYDLIVLVNPNSPTGQHISIEPLQELLRHVPLHTRIWVDETYVDYAGADQSLEQFAVQTENVIVCKSLSKAYALSGVRSAYLCAAPHQLEELRSITPPWAVSLPAQVAAVRALQDREYYADRYAETRALRRELGDDLIALGLDVIPGVANFLLGHLSESGPTAAEVVARCQERNLFLRDAAEMGSQVGRHGLRVAVKDAATNRRMIKILREILNQQPHTVASPVAFVR